MDNIGSRCTTITAVRGFRGKPQVFFTGGCPPTPEAGRWRRKGVGRREARRRLRGRRRPAAAHSGSRRSIRGRAAPRGPPATHPRGGTPGRTGRGSSAACPPPPRSWRRGASQAPPTAHRPSNGASPCPRRRDSTSPGTGRSSHARRCPSTERGTKHCMHLSIYLTNCRTVFLLQELNVEMRKS